MPPSQGLEDLGSESSIPPCLGVVSAAGWGPWGCPQPALQLEPEPLGFLFSGHWLWNTQVPVQFCGPPLCDLYSCVCVLGGEDQSTQEGQIKTQGGPPSQEQGCFMSRPRVGRGFGGCADGEPLRLPLSSFPPRVGESGGWPASTLALRP